MALGLVHAAQGRDDEAEQLLRERIEPIAASEHRLLQVGPLEALASSCATAGATTRPLELDERARLVLDDAANAARIA